MLNVAVSRAKDSFLVFGDMDVFEPFAKDLVNQVIEAGAKRIANDAWLKTYGNPIAETIEGYVNQAM